jgi:hypothetical protein
MVTTSSRLLRYRSAASQHTGPRTPRRLAALAAACIGALLLCIASPARATSLADIGFIHGLTLRGPHAEAEVYFPLPTGTTDADLAVDMTPSAALDQLSSITVYVGDEPLKTIPTRDGSQIVHVSIPGRLADGDFLHVRFAADQALRRDEQCFDNDNPSVWTHIAPSTQLTAAGGTQDGIGAIWRNLSGDVGIAMPANPTLADIQTGLILATAITVRGSRPVIVPADDNTAPLRVGRSATPLSVEYHTDLVANTALATPPQQRGRIVVADPAAARALVSASPVLRGLQTAVAAGEAVSGMQLSAPDSISFAELGLHPATLGVYSTSFVNMEIPFNRLPTGRRPVAIQLFGRGAAPPLEEAEVVTLSVGNRLLWSQTFRGAVEIDGIKVNLPEDLVRHHMVVTLRVVRVGSRRVCGADDALLFNLRDTTRFILADGGPTPPNFAAFSVSGDRPALVRYDVAPSAGVLSIPLVASLLSDAGARAADIQVTGPGTVLDRSFIVVAQSAPTDLTNLAPARLDQGRLVLDRPSDGAHVVINNASQFTLVQLTAAGAASGLWVSPGAASTLNHPQPLSSGDVAVFDGSGALPVSFVTRPEGAVVERPVSSVADQLLSRWRDELFVIGWIAVTLFTVLLILRLRRMRGR